jgi:two-component system, chemotaxis family, sensor kinase CheA
MDRTALGQLYRSESRDQLGQLTRAILRLERGEGGEGGEAVDEAFRAAHTLKGMAAAMEYPGVVQIAHGVEHLLDRVRQGGVVADSAIVDGLLKAAGELEQAIEASVSGAASPAGEPEWGDAGPIGAGLRTDARAQAGRLVRVEQGRIDALMDRATELLMAVERLRDGREEDGDAAGLLAGGAIDRAVSALRDDALRLRLAPVDELSDRLERVVRETGRSVGREVDLRIEGSGVEIDRGLLGDLSDLLIHLLRNAVDHGIESAAERAAAGKPPAGRVRVTAVDGRDAVTIRVSDDGRGIDPEAVRERAVAIGLREPGLSGDLDEAELLALLTRPGFSTARSVTAVSGRGVGLDHVASRLRELGGDLRMRSEKGRGATFIVTLPRTLSLTRVLMVHCGGHRVAMPVAALQRIDAPEKAGEAEPVVELADFLRYDRRQPASGSGAVLVIGRRARRLGLRVDAVLGFQDLVVKRFARPRLTPDVFAGAAVLADGTTCLVVDGGRLVAAAPAAHVAYPVASIR